MVSDKELTVIDPGAEAAKILQEIKKTGAKTKYIINTHHHFDHVLANKELEEKTGAKILANLQEGDKIKTGKVVLRVIQTPGHAEESICLAAHNFIFTGDTLFEGGCGRTDLPGSSEEKMEESLKKLSKLLKAGTMVYPGHGPSFRFRKIEL